MRPWANSTFDIHNLQQKSLTLLGLSLFHGQNFQDMETTHVTVETTNCLEAINYYENMRYIDERQDELQKTFIILFGNSNYNLIDDIAS